MFLREYPRDHFFFYGKAWLYQERLVSAVRSMANRSIRDRLMVERFHFREQEHENVIKAHYEIYLQALA